MWSGKPSLCEGSYLISSCWIWDALKNVAIMMRNFLNGDFEMRFGFVVSEQVVAPHDDLSL